MKRSFFLIILLLQFFQGYSQTYRVVYSSNSLPELYNEVNIFVQQQKGNDYKTLTSNKYQLSTSDAEYKNGNLIINRKLLQQNGGIINFTLVTKGQTIPLKLQLPILKNIRYNLYTDSIKPILNYYVNVEGEFSNGKILPLDSGMVTITANNGKMNGMEWVLPTIRNFESVTFTTFAKYAPELKITKTVYLKKYRDPRDASDYPGQSEEEIINSKKRR